jgi:hypothetical protein
MQQEWLAVEHHRIHVMETWPDGARKQAGLAAARATLESLARSAPKEFSFACTICGGMRRKSSCAAQIHTA